MAFEVFPAAVQYVVDLAFFPTIHRCFLTDAAPRDVLWSLQVDAASLGSALCTFFSSQTRAFKSSFST